MSVELRSSLREVVRRVSGSGPCISVFTFACLQSGYLFSVEFGRFWCWASVPMAMHPQNSKIVSHFRSLFSMSLAVILSSVDIICRH
jgi:hypothetical protein